MREIRFRAWDKGNSEMIYFDLTEAYHYCHADVMQYTGLKDKNGQEIYEGDIVEILWPKSMESYRYIVEWVHRGPKHLGGWEFVHPSKTSYAGSGNGQASVIGNIYSNPELLEE